MTSKIIKVEIDKIAFKECDLLGNDDAIEKIAPLLGRRAIAALVSDFSIRVKKDDAKPGNYILVSGHQLFRLLRACRKEGEDDISVKLCTDGDDAAVREATSLLLVPTIFGRSDTEIFGALARLKGHTGVPSLGNDLDLEKTWRNILRGGGKRPPRLNSSKQDTSIVLPKIQKSKVVSPASAGDSGEPRKKRGRPRKIVSSPIPIELRDSTSPLPINDQGAEKNPDQGSMPAAPDDADRAE